MEPGTQIAVVVVAAVGAAMTLVVSRQALRDPVPLSVSQRETIENLRQWLREGRARAASLPEADKGDESPPSTQSLDIRPPKSPRHDNT